MQVALIISACMGVLGRLYSILPLPPPLTHMPPSFLSPSHPLSTPFHILPYPSPPLSIPSLIHPLPYLLLSLPYPSPPLSIPSPISFYPPLSIPSPIHPFPYPSPPSSSSNLYLLPCVSSDLCHTHPHTSHTSTHISHTFTYIHTYHTSTHISYIHPHTSTHIHTHEQWQIGRGFPCFLWNKCKLKMWCDHVCPHVYLVYEFIYRLKREVPWNWLALPLPPPPPGSTTDTTDTHTHMRPYSSHSLNKLSHPLNAVWHASSMKHNRSCTLLEEPCAPTIKPLKMLLPVLRKCFLVREMGQWV